MPDRREFSQPQRPRLKRGSRVRTKDGVGETIGFNRRRNTNEGPGTGQYIVRLEDGRVRFYGANAVELVEE